MSVSTVLFDLDGTLLPMDQDVFVKTYFGLLAKKLAPLGYDPDKLVKTIWKATYAMINNDGADSNENVFWQYFCSVFGKDTLNDGPVFEEFYKTDFQKVKSVCGFEPAAQTLIHTLKQKGKRVVLATNPIFPAVATKSRIRWAGLDPSDFELYTTYENCRFSKPNPDYYKEIANILNVRPEQCLMVGNDVDDDMVAKKTGMQVFLLTRDLINKSGSDISSYPCGGFDELIEFAKKL